MLTIAPPRLAWRQRSAAATDMSQTPRRFVAMTRSKASGAVSSEAPPSAMPALLTRTSRGPIAASAAASARETELSSATSRSTATVFSAPAAPSSRRRASSRSRRRAPIATAAPQPARTRAKWAPSPLDAPVTKARLPRMPAARSMPAPRLYGSRRLDLGLTFRQRADARRDVDGQHLAPAADRDLVDLGALDRTARRRAPSRPRRRGRSRIPC